MTPYEEFFYFIVMIIAMMTGMSYLVNGVVKYHLNQLKITLNDQQKQAMKWLISSIVTMLTGYFCLLYFLLLR